MFVRKLRLILENLLLTRSSGRINTTERTPTFQHFSFLHIVLLLEKLISGLTDVHFSRLPSRLHPVKYNVLTESRQS